ncbi:MAG: helix-turn-helix transcriptional regulator [Alistipes sp.]|nr:helix-turn-helix transcriptional regulator [Alistipes sp.]
MQEKLRDFLNSEGLKPSQFAEMLGVNPAGISHLLAGRNKPGYELLQKMLRRFPQINPDWLLLDQGSMYRTQTETPAVAATSESTEQPYPQPNLFTAEAPTPSTRPSSQIEELPITTKISGNARHRATRIVICYEDGSFESYTPQL